MVVRSTPGSQGLAGYLNSSERARQRLASAGLLGQDERVGRQVESIFTAFRQLARKADDRMDYSVSSDLKWLQVLQHPESALFYSGRGLVQDRRVLFPPCEHDLQGRSRGPAACQRAGV